MKTSAAKHDLSARSCLPLAGIKPCGPKDSALDVIEEGWFRIALLGMPTGGIPGPPSVDIVEPSYRVVSHGAARVGALVEIREHMYACSWIRREVVPLVYSFPRLGQAERRRV